MPTTILLARHGQTEWNRDGRFQGHADPPLNELGRAQAHELAERLAGEPIAAVYASPLRRALETAQIVGERLGLPVETVDGLREVDVGSWSGLTRAEIASRFPEGYARWLAYGPGWDDGETYDRMGERVMTALGALARRHLGEHILVVTHGGPIRAAQAHALGIAHGEARRRAGVLGNCALARCIAEDGAIRWLD